MDLLTLKTALLGTENLSNPLDYAVSLFSNKIALTLIVLPISVFFLWQLFIGIVTRQKHSGRSITKSHYLLSMLGIVMAGFTIGGYLLLLQFVQGGD